MSESCRFIHAEKANYPIVLLRRALHMARSSCCAWREGEAACRRRQAADDALAHEITVLHIASRRTYGVPRIHAELRRLGRRVNRKRVARVMRERDIRGVTRREHHSLTRPDEKAKPGRIDARLGRPLNASVPPGRAQVSSSRNFGHWRGRKWLKVPGSFWKTTGFSIPASSRTGFCRAVGCRPVETRL
ncbi:IS3 family transposase [Streptomyces sp. NPDC015350]|uniref:IS3 family transposase n=1 Tax=Streptomyces sp. NPDC015350 TaxID=3364955 RepID=UPI0036FBC11F